jgi:hypothetical protein
MIPVIVKLCESPSRAGGLLMINYSDFKNWSVIPVCLIPAASARSYIAKSPSTYIYVVFSILALDQMVAIVHDLKRGLSHS